MAHIHIESHYIINPWGDKSFWGNVKSQFYHFSPLSSHKQLESFLMDKKEDLFVSHDMGSAMVTNDLAWQHIEMGQFNL